MKIMLHICCGVCAAAAARDLLDEGHEVLGYFFNPNIHPADEYALRLEAAHKVASEFGFSLVAGLYDPNQWLRETAGLAGEKEGGKRCTLCHQIRLKATYDYMCQTGAQAFTSTLTTGPKKSAQVINRIGRQIGGDTFLARDFKKKDGFKKASAMAQKLRIYRQDYCGCIYSRKEG